MPCPNAPQVIACHPSDDVLPVLACESWTVMNSSTAPSSIAGHGMPCPYCDQNAYAAWSGIGNVMVLALIDCRASFKML